MIDVGGPRLGRWLWVIKDKLSKSWSISLSMCLKPFTWWTMMWNVNQINPSQVASGHGILSTAITTQRQICIDIDHFGGRIVGKKMTWVFRVSWVMGTQKMIVVVKMFSEGSIEKHKRLEADIYLFWFFKTWVYLALAMNSRDLSCLLNAGTKDMHHHAFCSETGFHYSCGCLCWD